VQPECRRGKLQSRVRPYPEWIAMRARYALLGLLIAVVVLIGGVFAWAERYPAIDPIGPPSATSFSKASIEHGALLAALGNCSACHTRIGGGAYAGGFPVETQFGTIHSTNITPDPETGIGRWSEGAFSRAMHDGVDREGHYLYPAFPYDHFTKVTDADIRDLYAFLMTREPIRAEAPANSLPFPLNIRLLVAGWNLLFLERGVFKADPRKSDEWNRGAYLAEGLGHCGSCHTTRNFLGAEKRVSRHFAGGKAEGWDAPALDAASPAPAPWTGDELTAFLAKGWHANHGLAAGPMAEVVADVAKLPAADVEALAAYIASFEPIPSPDKTKQAIAFAGQREFGPTQIASVGNVPLSSGSEAAARGAEIFAGACATCHHRGPGLPASRPVPLALSSVANNPEPTNFLHIVLKGIKPRDGEAGPLMPGFGSVFSDRQLADLAAYVRSHFTQKPEWTNVLDDAARIRKQGEASALAGGS
jgi:mono/diheme cytochrome c family protein